MEWTRFPHCVEVTSQTAALVLVFFFFLYAPGNVFDGLAFRMFSGLYQSSNECYDKRSEKKKNKTKKTQKSKELKTSTILDLLFLSYLSCNFGDRLI